MNRRLLAALALAGGIACSSSVGSPGLGLSAPAAVAVFQGITVKNAGLHPYVAIANTGKDELVLVDAVDDQAVLSPVVIRPLSIPLPEPRPTRLVAGSFGDDGADLLVAVSAGSAVLQLVKTWDGDTRVVAKLGVDLGAVVGGADILAIAAAPVPVQSASGGWTSSPGRVRVVAALSGGRLAVQEYARATDGSGSIVLAGAPVVQDLALGSDRFGVVGLAVNAADPRFVYAATQDPIPVAATTAGAPNTLVLGVAELDATAAPGAWPWRALSARAPTTAVAVWRLMERLQDSVRDDAGAFQPAAVDRVYAALDPSACGPAFPIDCGIAVIDPVTGQIPPDPAGLMPYLPPIHLPGVPSGVVVSPPPSQGPPDAPTPAAYAAPYMRIAPSSGQRTTTGVAAIPSSNGHVYFADLARWTIPNDSSMLRTESTRTAVTAASTFPATGSKQELGLWDPKATTPTLVRSGTELIASAWVTPGFTPTDTWSVVYQGLLPGLSFRRAQVGPGGAVGPSGEAQPWLAIQIPGPAGGAAFTQVGRLYGAELGVQVGDIAQIDTKGVESLGIPAGMCPLDDAATTVHESVIEARIAAFLIPDATRPGGAVVLQRASDPMHPEWDRCLDALGAAPAVIDDLAVAIRASGFVLIGQAAGYAGRPELVAAPNAVTNPNLAGFGDDHGFQLRYEDEDQLACPVEPWPANPSAVDCTSAACRAGCERLILARKARRFYYVSDACIAFEDCVARWDPTVFDFPKANGPALAFKLGLHPDAASPAAPVARDTSLVITTRSGLSPASRGPTTTTAAQILPTGVATFDRSTFPGKAYDGYRFYAAYASGFVLDFSPSQPPNLPVTIR